ncbi:hypothetical protein BH23THE1_BH23THE1_17400 [soil metagenome]
MYNTILNTVNNKLFVSIYKFVTIKLLLNKGNNLLEF